MNVCDVCGYKVASNKYFERHKQTHVVQYPDSDSPTLAEPETKEPVVEVPVETFVEATPPVEEVSEVKPIEPEIPEEIVLRFTKPVEISINGVHYFGTEIKVKEMRIAAELVRIARTAYGVGILK